MSQGYHKHHYVPQWYQKRFLGDNKSLYYLDLHPPGSRDSKGVTHIWGALRRCGPGSCFAEENLYRIKLGSHYSSAIETRFFGKVDTDGSEAVDYFSNFAHPSVDHKAVRDLLLYMSTQKLRTPKGLNWLAAEIASNRNATLERMLKWRHIYCAVWTECVWQIADATDSETKFIISDHPVTVYNRQCGPRSSWCRDFNDPDVRYNATHTMFPLDRNHILILTNLSWVRNPHQKERNPRPHPRLFGEAIFNFTRIQTLRRLSEQEVREINFIIKSRAYRYIAAEVEEWLYPEKHVCKSDWYNYGKGYLLMPDPRAVHAGGEILMGWDDGRTTSFDPYGRRPWQSAYNNEGNEFETLERFKGEFAHLFGPERRGRSFDLCELDRERDSDDMHQRHLRRYKKSSRK